MDGVFGRGWMQCGRRVFFGCFLIVGLDGCDAGEGVVLNDLGRMMMTDDGRTVLYMPYAICILIRKSSVDCH